MSEPNHTRVVFHISTVSIIKVVAVLAAAWLVYYLRNLVVLVYIALLLATTFDPLVSALQRRRVPRALGAALIYLVVFVTLSAIVALLLPLVAQEISGIVQNFPTYWNQWKIGLGDDGQISQTVQDALESLRATLAQSAGNVMALARALFGDFVSLIVVLVLTFYFLIQGDILKRTFTLFTPPAHRSYVAGLTTRMQQQLSQWLRGVLLLGLIVGSLTLVGLMILRVRYFLVLALVAGVMELIPYVGPIISAVPAIFFAASDSVWKGIAVLILYWIVQQLENHLIVPKVMEKAVGLNPAVIILIILVGAKLAGFVGVLVAVPTAAALSVWLKDVYSSSLLGAPAAAQKDAL